MVQGNAKNFVVMYCFATIVLFQKVMLFKLVQNGYYAGGMGSPFHHDIASCFFPDFKLTSKHQNSQLGTRGTAICSLFASHPNSVVELLLNQRKKQGLPPQILALHYLTDG